MCLGAEPYGASFPARQEAAHCRWDSPGRNPFTGDVVGVVDDYTDIPADVRARLKRRMALRQYDDMVSIRRDSIAGKRHYAPEMRDMHSGNGSVCKTITRERWTARMEERGLVYCESGECVMVPTICRNVSRITAIAPPVLAAAAPPAGGGGAAPAPEGGVLLFDAPSAGLPPQAGSTGPLPGPGLSGAAPLLTPSRDSAQPPLFVPQIVVAPRFIPELPLPPSPPPPAVPELPSWMLLATGMGLGGAWTWRRAGFAAQRKPSASAFNSS